MAVRLKSQMSKHGQGLKDGWSCDSCGSVDFSRRRGRRYCRSCGKKNKG